MNLYQYIHTFACAYSLKISLYLPTPPHRQDVTQGQFLAEFKSEFSFSNTGCLTEARENSLPYYLPIAGGRIIGSIPFPRILVLCEIQSRFELVSPSPFPTTINITQRVPSFYEDMYEQVCMHVCVCVCVCVICMCMRVYLWIWTCQAETHQTSVMT